MEDEEIERLTRIVEIILGVEWDQHIESLASALECIIHMSHFGQVLAERQI